MKRFKIVQGDTEAHIIDHEYDEPTTVTSVPVKDHEQLGPVVDALNYMEQVTLARDMSTVQSLQGLSDSLGARISMLKDLLDRFVIGQIGKTHD